MYVISALHSLLSLHSSTLYFYTLIQIHVGFSVKIGLA